MSVFDPHEYAITIQRVEVDGDTYFEATVRELPDLRDYSDSYDSAYALAIDSIVTAYEMYQDESRVFPPPMKANDFWDYSGRVTLRMGKSLHARVVASAEYEGVSLNSYICTVLAYHAGRRLGERPGSGYGASVFPVTSETTSVSSGMMTNVVPIGGGNNLTGAYT
ncbi:MAG: type II toxin-antitoxin system HicB family antitoxin [Candidatus Thiodiazotropha sp. (ex Lucinoma borealis)]|nr:type II toxin-antitoxin system HicB family antitoxin [Candidatus Thiodiazotropha sp. (ex Lucinoma borealis)]MCU7868248.1 type II toxin-antitoxin system HicB family antitoxin [Candidatus Thiodiazotropha sp. (ex Lucinoma borealis)]